MTLCQAKTEIENLLKKISDIIELDWSTYSGWKIKARFIDKEFGEWWQTPRRVLIEGRRHKKRAALNRAATNLAKYGTANAAASEIIKDKIKKVNLERYGVENPSTLDSIKAKIVKTNMEKYGVKAPLQNKEILAKAEATNMARYGVKTTLLTDKAREGLSQVDRSANVEKAIQTNLERYGNKCSLHGNNQSKTDEAIKAKYGVSNYAQTEECTEKMRETYLKKYGVDWYSKTDEYKQQFKETSLERFGVEHPFQAEEVKKKIRTSQVDSGFLVVLPNGQSKRSWYLEYQPDMCFSHLCGQTRDKVFNTMEEWETAVSQISQPCTSLELRFGLALGTEFYNKKPHPEIKYRPDFKFTDTFYVNVDGLFWHSDKVIQETYHHMEMQKAYESLGLTIWQFHQDEVESKMDIIKSMVNNKLGLSNRIAGRKTTLDVAAPNDITLFIEENHLMGIGTSKRNVVLRSGSDIVAAMIYKVKDKTLIIDRYCSKVGINVLGGFSKLLKQVQLAAPETNHIEYWVDLRYGSGDFLANLGFDRIRDVLSWKWTDGYTTRHRLTSWSSPADVEGWYKIYDAGQRLWVKELNGKEN